MKKELLKISVVVPCYRTDKLIPRCLESILDQTYHNLEIICVNDGSGDDTLEILKEFKARDKRIKVVSYDKNKGLFLARMMGAQKATGDYIAFVDSDDYIERDYFRQMLNDATENDSDLVIGNFCREDEKYQLVHTDLNKYLMLPSKELSTFDQFINSEGRFFRWHVIWNKLIKKELWDKASPTFEKVDKHLVMCEDVLFSTMLLSLAKNVYLDDDVFYFYCDSGNSSTSSNKTQKENSIKNIDDIVYVFSLLAENLNKKYLPHLIKWRNAYINIWINNTIKSEIGEVREHIKTICDDYQRADLNIFAATLRHLAPFDRRLLNIKEQIMAADTISFDVFDTLVLRPFLEPHDLFTLLEKPAAELLNSNHILPFSNLRRIAESECRELTDAQEVTIDDIYDRLVEVHGVDKKTAKKLRSLEEKLEEDLCYTRKYGKHLYDFAKYIGKRIVIASDMYLPGKTIKNILEKNGYREYDAFYLSNELGVTKWSGDLYKYMLEHEPKGVILHIDDSEYNCDMASKDGIKSFFVPRTINAFYQHGGGLQYYFYDRNHNHDNYLKTSGVRASIAMIGNKFFDNPFLPFDQGSNLNNSPYYLGYYTLGMHMLAIANWLLEDAEREQLDTLVFFARDGYLPLKCTEILQEKYGKKLNLEYFYTSRSSTMPLALDNKFDFGASMTYMAWDYETPMTALKHWGPVVKLPKNYKKLIQEAGFNPNKTFKTASDFYVFMNYVRNNFYSHDQFLIYREMAQEYTQQVFQGKTGVFDIGYSAKPELLTAQLTDNLATTYFIHINSHTSFSEGYHNARLAGVDLKTFYDFAPTFTGVLREAFFSAIAPSCKTYRRTNGKVEPVFSSKVKYDPYTKDVLNTAQMAAMQFVADFCEAFGDRLGDLDFNRYYMSLPFEHYMHYSLPVDRIMFEKMYFEDNANKYVKVTDFWTTTEKNYFMGFSLYGRDLTAEQGEPQLPLGITNLPLRRSSRLFYYTLFDRKMLREKYSEKTRAMEFSPSLLRRISFHLLHNRKAIPVKIKKKLRRK